jgi:hypothetical protein
MAYWGSNTEELAEQEVRQAVDGLNTLKATLEQVAREISAACVRYADLPPGEEWDDAAGAAFEARAHELLVKLSDAEDATFDAVSRAETALIEVLGELAAA